MSTVEMGMMAKEMKVRKKTKRKWNKTVGILLYVTAMVIIVTLAALYQRIPQRSPKEPADKYFSFSEAFALATPLDPKNNSIKIEQLSFYITAAGGNATEVLVIPYTGLVPQEESWGRDKILHGETVEVGPIMYPSGGVVIEKQESGYPLLFRIGCHEAEGFVYINVTEFISPT